jgi:hypothetical protein
LISPRWSYHGGVPKHIGYPYLIALALAPAAVISRKEAGRDATTIFLLVTSLLSLFMMFEASVFVWELFPPFRFAQFPWRFLNLLAFPAAFILGTLGTLVEGRPALGKLARATLVAGPPLMAAPFLFLEEQPDMRSFNKVVLAVLSAGAVLIAIWLRWRKPGRATTDRIVLMILVISTLPLSAVPLHHHLYGKPRELPELRRRLSPRELRATMNTGGHGHPFLPRTVKRLPRRPRPAPVEVVGGDADLNNLSQLSDRLAFSAEVRAPSQIRINVFFFPGWRARVDGKEAPVEVDQQGRMNLSLPAGSHQVQVRFENTPVRRTAYGLSATSLLLLGMVAVYGRRRRRPR